MTREEIAAMQRMVDEAVARRVDGVVTRVVQPIREELDTNKILDQSRDKRLDKHSGTHSDLAANVRASQSEVEQSTNEKLLALQRHMARTLESFREEMSALAAVPRATAGAEAAAVAAGLAAREAKSATTDLAISAVTSNATAKATRNEARWRTVGTILAMIGLAAFQHCAAKGAL